MSRRKPNPCACGVCGRAVVRPEQAPAEGDVWRSGHHYVDGRLVEVRCREHEPETGWDDFMG